MTVSSLAVRRSGSRRRPAACGRSPARRRRSRGTPPRRRSRAAGRPGRAQHAGPDEVARDGRRLRRRPRVSGVSNSVGAIRVHAHAAVDPFEREGARQLHDAALGRQVGGRVRVGDEAADRGDVDDAAACPRPASARRTPGGQVRALEVECETASKRSSGKSSAGRAEGDAGAVDEHVDAAERGHHVGGGARRRPTSRSHPPERGRVPPPPAIAAQSLGAARRRGRPPRSPRRPAPGRPPSRRRARWRRR